MGSFDLDQDIAPIPRSREENQERAFIAASRRKDRGLDARLESAHRASMLHKKRTGNAFHITKEIVGKEAIYEEVDERYQEKLTRMFQAQNMQMEEQFHRHPLASFAARVCSTGSSSSIASRRASMTPRASIDGGSSRKMSLDLSHLRSSSLQGLDSNSLTKPMATSDGYAMSPSANFDPNAQYYMSCIDITPAVRSEQIPAYVNQPTPLTNQESFRPVQMQWAAIYQQVPTPNQTPTTDCQAVHLWQQQMMQQAKMPSESASQMRQFRHRLTSAPELPTQRAALPDLTARIFGPSTATDDSGFGHSRGSSYPTNDLQLLTQGIQVAQTDPFSIGSPDIEALSAETQSTRDFCFTPNTPISTNTNGLMPSANPTAKNGDIMIPLNGEFDADMNEFIQFAHRLDHPSLSERDSFIFDRFFALDESGTETC